MAATKHLKTDSAKTKAVEFKCDALTAQQVFVAWTFNEWKPDATPLVRDRVGNWPGSLKLPPGHYADTMSSSSSWMVSGAVSRGARANTAAVPNAYRTTSAR